MYELRSRIGCWRAKRTKTGHRKICHGHLPLKQNILSVSFINHASASSVFFIFPSVFTNQRPLFRPLFCIQIDFNRSLKLILAYHLLQYSCFTQWEIFYIQFLRGFYFFLKNKLIEW